MTVAEELKKRIADVQSLIYVHIQDGNPNIDESLTVWELHIKLDVYKEILELMEPKNAKA